MFCSPHDPDDLRELLGKMLVLRPEGGPQPLPAEQETEPSSSIDGLLERFPPELQSGLALLRHRIGEAAMRHLLTQTTMFWPLGDDCLVQITGPPPARHGASSMALSLPPAPAAGERARRRLPAAPPMAHERHAQRKRPRLSSWRRRKQQRLEAAATAAAAAAAAAEEDKEDEEDEELVGMDELGPEGAAAAGPQTAVGSSSEAAACAPTVSTPASEQRGCVVPRGRELHSLMGILLRRHCRTSYHQLLCAHMPLHRPRSAPGTLTTWTHVHNFGWAVGASVVPSRLLGTRL